MPASSLSLAPYRKALDSLNRALARPKDEYLRDSVIQRFEFAYELAWKTLKRYLELEEGGENVEALQRRDLFRLAGEKGLLDDPGAWLAYHRSRNETSHTYEEAKAEEVYAMAKQFSGDAGKLLNMLEKRLPNVP